MDVRDGLWRKLSAEELMLLNCVLEKTLESPLDCKEIQPVLSKGDQPWVFFGGNDAEAETPVPRIVGIHLLFYTTLSIHPPSYYVPTLCTVRE